MKTTYSDGTAPVKTLTLDEIVRTRAVYKALSPSDYNFRFITFGDGEHFVVVGNNDLLPFLYDTTSSWNKSKFVLSDTAVTFKN